MGNSDTLKLAAIQLPDVRIIRDLRRDEGKAYERAVEYLRDHSQAIIEMVRRNWKAYSDSRQDLSRRIPVGGQRGALQRKASIELNRLLLNLLASMRQFLDHTETRLKRRYSNAPEMYEAFRARTAAAFDGSFAYRFMYKLRNFGQHCAAPIGLVDIESTAVGPGGMVLHTLHVKFDPKLLLQEGNDVWGPVGKDLRAMSAPFDVHPLLIAVVRDLDAIWDVVRAAEKPALAAFAAECVSVVSDVPQDHIPAVFRLVRRDKMYFILPPFDVLEWLGVSRFRPFI